MRTLTPSSLPNDFFARLARPEIAQDPHPLLDSLRGAAPARLRNGDLVLVGHADVVGVLRSPEFGKPPMPAPPIKTVRTLRRMFLMADAPDHPRLRRSVAPLFTPAAVAQREDRVRDAVERLLHRRDDLDVVSELAYPLPLELICDWLGAESVDRHRIWRWGSTLTAALDSPIPAGISGVTAAAAAVFQRRMRPLATLAAAKAIVDHARRVIRDDRRSGEIVDTLRTAVADGVMSEDEAVATWVLLVIAGHETTANLIANATFLLLSNPDQRDLVTDDPTRREAVEEALRLESPVPLGVRVATRDTRIGEHTVRQGQLAYVVLAAANRDPKVFEDPHRFVVGRSTTDHVAFGHGSHFCIGARLARLEATTVLDALLAKSVQLVEPRPTWRPSFATRGLQHLHIKLR